MATFNTGVTDYHLSERIAGYMRRRFRHLALDPDFPRPALPLDIPSHGCIGMNQLVSVLVKAYKNRSRFIAWL